MRGWVLALLFLLALWSYDSFDPKGVIPLTMRTITQGGYLQGKVREVAKSPLGFSKPVCLLV